MLFLVLSVEEILQWGGLSLEKKAYEFEQLAQ